MRSSIEFLYYLLLWFDPRYLVDPSVKPGLNRDRVYEKEIPLPPVAVQERIVEVLQQADAIRRKRAEARRLADQILPALFLDMFGDPATNPNAWPVTKLGDCTSLVTSGYTPRGGAQNYTDEGPLLIRSQNVRMLSLDLSDCAHLPVDIFEAMARIRVLPNDVLLNITGASIGRTAFVNEDIPPSVVNQHVCIIRLQKDTLAPEFLAYLLSMPLYQHIIQNSPGSAQSGFNHQRVRDLDIPVPPISLQRNFGAHISYIQENFSEFASTDSISESLQSVLLTRAFTGELTAEWEATNADWIAEHQAFYERLPRLALLSLLLERRERAGRDAVTLITALMKYAFLAQMEGELRRRLYRFFPYYYGPCAMDLYDNLKALAADGLVAVENDAQEEKTCITLTDPDRAAALLDAEARKDDALLAAIEDVQKDSDAETDPDAAGLLKRRAEILETLRTDAATILDAYGDLDHNDLLKAVYEKYPAYAKKRRLRRKRG